MIYVFRFLLQSLTKIILIIFIKCIMISIWYLFNYVNICLQIMDIVMDTRRLLCDAGLILQVRNS